MPHNVPVKLKDLRKLGMLDEEKFFSDIADEAGFTDTESIKKMYMAMVRVITKRLTTYYGTRLPHLAEIQLPMFKERPVRMGNETVTLPARRHIKFYPNVHWQRHINAKLGYRKY